MQKSAPTKRLSRVGTCILLGGLFASAGAQAEVTLNAGLRINHESNVNGAPDKRDQRSDTSTALAASAVYYTALDSAKNTYLIGQAGVLGNKYNTYGALDNSLVNASVGLYRQLSSSWSGQVTGRGFARDTKQNERDSNGLGTTLELKKQLTSTVWIKGVADYEDSKANLSAYSYTGKTLGINTGFLPRQDTFVSFGYSHTKRDFDTAVSFKTTTRSAFADLTRQMSKNWYLSGTYSLQDNDSSTPNSAYKNHVLSIAANFSY